MSINKRSNSQSRSRHSNVETAAQLNTRNIYDLVKITYRLTPDWRFNGNNIFGWFPAAKALKAEWKHHGVWSIVSGDIDNPNYPDILTSIFTTHANHSNGNLSEPSTVPVTQSPASSVRNSSLDNSPSQESANAPSRPPPMMTRRTSQQSSAFTRPASSAR